MSTTPISSSTTGGSTSTGTTTNPSLNLSSSDFINMMMTELQNQDPLDPTDSQAMLAQMSSIGQLQSSDQLQTTLTQFSFQNQMASAGNLIGKTVTGVDASNNNASGVVTGVSAVNSQVYLNILNSGGAADQIPMNNISGVTNPAAAAATSAVTTAATTTTTTTTPATTTNQSAAASLIQGIVGML